MEKIVVDARGKQCPIPVVMANQAMAALTGPATLEVHVDNEIAVQNLLRMAAGKSFPAQSRQAGEKDFVVTVAADRVSPQEADAPVVCAPDARGDTVVAIGTAVMGVGSEQLGATLMKGFIYALSQQAVLPRTVLFYNGGAHLTCEGSASLEDLRNMAAQGVEIMTCGTCLDFYGLKDKLAVGTVTNMYSIVETLMHAGKVVKP